MSVSHRALSVFAIVLPVLALGGCDESEQGRILRYEQGVYKGQPDTPIDDATREELRQRARQLVG